MSMAAPHTCAVKTAATLTATARRTRPRHLPFSYSVRPGCAGASDLVDRRSASKYYRVDVRDTRHLDFTDMNSRGGALRDRGAYGAIAPQRAAELTRLIVREYFGEQILGRRSALLAGQTRPPELRVAELRKP
jgi:hypothetical protein